MSDFARSMGSRLSKQVLRLRDKTLLEGAMATGALVALADRKLAVEESLAVQNVIANAELLRIYDTELALTLYSRYVERLRNDFADGKAAALNAIGLCADDIEAAELIVNVGIAIAKADKDFTSEELEVIEEICARVGVEGLDTLGMVGSTPSRLH